MSIPTKDNLSNDLSILWAIASKDIVDALKNKVVLSMIIMLSILLLMPKLLPYLFEQSQTVLPVYDLGDSRLLAELEDIPDIAVQKLRSMQELNTVLCGAMNPLVGLVIPADFDQLTVAGGPIEIQGYVCWGRRHQVAEVRSNLEEILSQSLERLVVIQIEGNIVYPPSDGVLTLSLATVNSVLLVLMMGIFLVPSLLIEEKETRTLQALLVSPASIGQVVIGKALAGAFYILVTAAMMFAISWVEVTHWGTVVLFVVGGGVFSVALGLVLGSIFEKQQDMVGWMTGLMLFLVSAPLVKMFGLALPAWVASILPWVPSVALAEICLASFSETISAAQIWTNLGFVLAVSVPLYFLVIWKIRRSDR
jgi:ABC-2 type transport system permease protein